MRISYAEKKAVIGRAAIIKQTMPDVLYIMGTGRSGTTVLEILLTNSPGLMGTGELKHIFRDGFLGNRKCACGKPALECNLWSRVLAAMEWNQADVEKMERTVAALEQHWRFPFVAAGLVSQKEMTVYKQSSEVLFKAVAMLTRSQVIVDSSKYAGRALVLTALFPSRVKVLCVTRSAAGLIAAFKKNNVEEQRPKSILIATAYYLYVLLCMWIVRARIKERCLSVRFEDLKCDPGAVLNSIEKWSGYSLAVSQRKLLKENWFEVGHIVTGNRIRKKGRIKFELGWAESALSSAHERLAAKVLEIYRRLLGF